MTCKLAHCVLKWIIVVGIVVQLSDAIYDPRATTVKPHERREDIPWYLDVNPRPPPPFPGVKSSSHQWKKLPGSDLEISKGNANEYVEKTPNLYDVPFEYFGEKDNLAQEKVKGQKGIPREQNLYDKADDYHKPRKEVINNSHKRHASVVAKYDQKTGAECPYPDADGQFIYPPDCKFFVNCWKGRAFVQPCAPGTYFNPESLECDFPHKVICYGERRSDQVQIHSPGKQVNQNYGQSNHFEGHELTHLQPPSRENSQNSWKPGRQIIQTLTCPEGFSGLLAHPSECTKFLQCDHGIAHIMDCGPGTVFNPSLSVCDWPYNVPGCGVKPTPAYPPTPASPTWRPADWSTGIPANRYENSKNRWESPPPSGGNTRWTPTPRPTQINYPGGWYSTQGQGQYSSQGQNSGGHYSGQGQYPGGQQSNQDTGYYPTPHHQGRQDRRNNRRNFRIPEEPATDLVPPKPEPNIGLLPPKPAPKPQLRPHQQNYPQWSQPEPTQPAYSQGNWNSGRYQPHVSQNPHNYPTNPNRYPQNAQSPNNYPQNRQNPNNYPQNRNDYPTNSYNYPNNYPTSSNRAGYGRTKPEPPQWHPNSGPYGGGSPGGPADQGQGWRPTSWDREDQLNAEGENTDTLDDKLNQWQTRPNIIHWETKRRDQDAKMDDWASKSNIFHQAKGQSQQGTKQSAPSPSVSVNINGTTVQGHYIVHQPEITQGHSKTRFNDNSTNDYQPPRSTSEQGSTWNESIDDVFPPIDPRFDPETTAKPSPSWNKPDIDSPTVSIEDNDDDLGYEETKNTPTTEEDSREDLATPNDSGANEDLEIDVLDKGNKTWKPKVVFEDKSKKEDKSVVMHINNNKHNMDVDLFDVKAASSAEDEPPFPLHYPAYASESVLDNVEEEVLITPSSGQYLRLRGGNSAKAGYVEVQGMHPGWGVVCDVKNGWSLREANVVCRQLGYTRGAETVWQGRPSNPSSPTWIATTSVQCKGNETKFQSCKFIQGSSCDVEREAVGVSCLPNRLAHCRKDEVAHAGNCYHLADPDTGLNHAEALQYCIDRNSRLVDIISQSENNFLSDWLTIEHPRVVTIMTSGVGFTMMNMTVWIWEDSEKAQFKFTKWWPGWKADKPKAPWTTSRPSCITMRKSFGCYNHADRNCSTDYFFWNSEDCATSMKGHSYVCKRPYDDIGCVYGKGHQYSGKANITGAGSECLPWNEQKVAYALMAAVPDRDVRSHLKEHNYCRNPNPRVESRPWCFVGGYGDKEYCDIPACGNDDSQRTPAGGQCKKGHFECHPEECIPSHWVCDGEEDCTNGKDEQFCSQHLDFFEETSQHKLDGYDVEKWLNTPVKTCALRCKSADFTCRSFSHKAKDNLCLLSDQNIGSSGALIANADFDFYEMTDRKMNCDNMFACDNQKCINQSQVCDGKNDCGDRSDENICTAENLGYEIRLRGSDKTNEGRLEVKVLGHWGQVCDDGFGMIDAEVICRELGFNLGALEVRPGGFFGNMDPSTVFMVDQLKCRGNETSLRECDFNGWGIHDCSPEEAVGIVCKTATDTCKEGEWKCDNSPTCIPTPFICDEVKDCPDGSDESTAHCQAPFEIRLANGSRPNEGRVEIKHHGVWGTICDDDFSHTAARVICRSLGYNGNAIAKKNAYFGGGQGPIWMDEVACHGNETQLYRCSHADWGRSNCNHDEDAGVVCQEGSTDEDNTYEPPELTINDILPSDCGKRLEDFDESEEMFARVVRGSVAPRDSYPWQASIRVRGHSRSNHWCGAVVISPLHVLTAAHCLEGYNKGTYFVRAGDYNTEIDEGTEVEVNIEDYYIHEDFRKGQRMNNDIALVLLKGRGIPLGPHIMPICLPPRNAEYSTGLNCTISGFGSIESGRSAHSRDLRFGWIPLIDQELCRAEWVYGQGRISDGMVCAGYMDEGVDACDGDSGGPLACQQNGAFTLYGITSWGQHCGEANKPGVYVKISHYRDWIDTKIRESLTGR